MSKLASFLYYNHKGKYLHIHTSTECSIRIIYYYLLGCSMPWGFATHHEDHPKHLLWNFILDGTLKEENT